MHQVKAFPGRIIFDHLAKTAGQAVNAWLTDHLGTGCVTPNLIGNHRELIRKYGGEYSIISAHTFFHEKEGLDPRYQYITVLREPISRAISWIFYLINSTHETESAKKLQEGAKLFLASEGKESNNSFIESITNPYTTHFGKIHGSTDSSDTELINNCISTLKQYSAVGFQENLDNFLENIAILIGFDIKKKSAKINTTNNKAELSEKLLTTLTNINSVDIEFYKTAQLEFEKLTIQEKFKNYYTEKWEYYNPHHVRIIQTDKIELLKATLIEGNNIFRNSLMTFHLDFSSHVHLENIEIGIHIFDDNLEWAFGVNNRLLNTEIASISHGVYRVVFNLIADLPHGSYTAGFAVAEYSQNYHTELFWHDELCHFNIIPTNCNPVPGVGHSPLLTTMSFFKIKYD